MGRVKPSQARERKTLSSGIPFFKWEEGKKYKVIFPSLPDEKDAFMYNEVVHNVNLNGNFKKLRCINSDYQIDDSAALAVVKMDENGGFEKDPASGRVLNDGTCPLCEFEYLFRQKVFADVEAWKKENPDATDKEIKKQYSERFDANPVSAAYKNTEDGSRELDQSNILLGIVFKLDEKNKYVLDNEGNPTYDLNIFDMSSARFDKFMAAAETANEYMSPELAELSDDMGFAWQEFEMNFPDKGNRAQAGKDLTINPVPPGRSAIEEYDNLKNTIEENDLKDVEKIEEVFDNLPSLKVRSIPELEKELQGRLEQYRAELSDEEKDELEEKISNEEKTVSGEDAENIIDGEVSSGADSFEAGDGGEEEVPNFLKG